MIAIQIGQQVKLASIPDIVFTVIAKNLDGSFQIEGKLSAENMLTYAHICGEMLRPISPL